jgi:hypothetical protein
MFVAFFFLDSHYDFGKPSAQGQSGNVEGALLYNGKGVCQREIALSSGGCGPGKIAL